MTFLTKRTNVSFKIIESLKKVYLIRFKIKSKTKAIALSLTIKLAYERPNCLKGIR